MRAVLIDALEKQYEADIAAADAAIKLLLENSVAVSEHLNHQKELDKLNKVFKNLTMHLGRGIRTVKLRDIPDPQPRPSTEGMGRITNRGTGSRPSRTKGDKQ